MSHKRFPLPTVSAIRSSSGVRACALIVILVLGHVRVGASSAGASWAGTSSVCTSRPTDHTDTSWAAGYGVSDYRVAGSGVADYRVAENGVADRTVPIPDPLRNVFNFLRNVFTARGSVLPKHPGRPELVQAILDSNRVEFARLMGDTLTVMRDTLGMGHPESPIGNFAADALRYRAARELGRYVHIGVLDEGSLQRYFLPGPVTLAGVYELMPYENTLVVLHLTGTQLKELAEQMAARGGGPVSGIRFSIRHGTLGYLLVNRSTIEPEQVYLVATSSYLAAGYGPYPVLWKADNRTDTGIGLRQVFIDAFSSRPSWTSPIDQRIVEQTPRP